MYFLKIVFLPIPKFLKINQIILLITKFLLIILKKVRAQGFEPWTNRSGAERSAAELYPHMKVYNIRC